MPKFIVAHGGTGSRPAIKDGTDAAVEAGLQALLNGTPTDAVVAAVAVLEDDERFNCGTGSALRFDGRTIEMDAAVMESDRGYGAVCGIEHVKNPIMVAKELVALPNNILKGPAADAFARRRGFPRHDPWTSKAEKQWKEIIGKILAGKASEAENQWDLPTLERSWNYPRPFREIFGDLHMPKSNTKAKATGKGKASKGTRDDARKTGKGHQRSSSPGDTVGAVAFDGNSFAAASSTGGTITTLRGRIGDTPTLGAGIYASDNGATACSGSGDQILRKRLATRVDELLASGKSARQAVDRTLREFPKGLDLCLIVADENGYAARGTGPFAWSAGGHGIRTTMPSRMRAATG